MCGKFHNIHSPASFGSVYIDAQEEVNKRHEFQRHEFWMRHDPEPVMESES